LLDKVGLGPPHLDAPACPAQASPGQIENAGASTSSSHVYSDHHVCHRPFPSVAIIFGFAWHCLTDFWVIGDGPKSAFFGPSLPDLVEKIKRMVPSAVISLIRACEEIDEWGGHFRLRREQRRKRLVSGFAGTRARRPRHSIFLFFHTLKSGNDDGAKYRIRTTRLLRTGVG
jgi:hypothetical protein